MATSTKSAQLIKHKRLPKDDADTKRAAAQLQRTFEDMKAQRTAAQVKEEINRLYKYIPKLKEHFNIQTKIGSGSFSSVFEAEVKASKGLKFALKYLVPTVHPDRIERELLCMEKAEGKNNVAKMEAIVMHEGHVAFIMPYFQHTKLQDVLPGMTVLEVVDYMYNLLVALKHIHSLRIIHRDVKPANFLYDPTNRAKPRYLLIDFGLAEEYTEKNQNQLQAHYNSYQRRQAQLDTTSWRWNQSSGATRPREPLQSGVCTSTKPPPSPSPPKPALPKRRKLPLIIRQKKPGLTAVERGLPNSAKALMESRMGGLPGPGAGGGRDMQNPFSAVARKVAIPDWTGGSFGQNKQVSLSIHEAQTGIQDRHKGGGRASRKQKLHEMEEFGFSDDSDSDTQQSITPWIDNFLNKADDNEDECQEVEILTASDSSSDGRRKGPCCAFKHTKDGGKTVTDETAEMTQHIKGLALQKERDAGVKQPFYINLKAGGINSSANGSDSDMVELLSEGLDEEPNEEATMSIGPKEAAAPNKHKNRVSQRENLASPFCKPGETAGGVQKPKPEHTGLSSRNTKAQLFTYSLQQEDSPAVSAGAGEGTSTLGAARTAASWQARTGDKTGKPLDTTTPVPLDGRSGLSLVGRTGLPLDSRGGMPPMAADENQENVEFAVPGPSAAPKPSLLPKSHAKWQRGFALPLTGAPKRKPSKKQESGANKSGVCECYGQAMVCSICLNRPDMEVNRGGTPGYRPPEVLMRFMPHSPALDIWAAGVIFLSLLTKRCPFFHGREDMICLAEITSLLGTEVLTKAAEVMGKKLTMHPMFRGEDLKWVCKEIRDVVLADKPQRDDWRNVSDSAYDLLKKLLDPNPFTRITAEKALEHPFFIKYQRQT